jgi:imidazolonepropionase-like amidohydrolase
MLGYEGKLGIIAPGAIADLVIMAKNPLEDIKILDRPEENLVAVVKAGRLITGTLEGFPKEL